MKGRNKFTKAEAEAIKKLLDEIIALGRYDSLTVANKPRVLYQFFITDFKPVGKPATHYSSADFDASVAEGRITISE